MIDLTLLRQEPERVKTLLKLKEPTFDVARLIDLESQVRSLRIRIEGLRHKKNELADQAKAGLTPVMRQESIAIGKELKEVETELVHVETAFNDLALSCPNLPYDDVPEGGKEANRVVKTVGTKPEYSFALKNHLELTSALGWIDFEAGTRIAGSQFPLYRGVAAKMIYALTRLMIKNNLSFGYELISPPTLVNEQSLIVSGNFPKFRDQVYAVSADQLYLTPTAEVDLASIYRNAILSADQLPLRMTAWTSCFRREAGGYGATERGLIRIHQFEKVELFTLCDPQDSHKEQERMLACAESILQQLGLHYRISLLAGQDCSFASAKTYDIEVWLPGQNSYFEVSSISDCTTFQARRGLIRFKRTPTAKNELVHTLNGSSLALSRLMVALFETYQQPDGTIVLPEILASDPIFSW